MRSIQFQGVAGQLFARQVLGIGAACLMAYVFYPTTPLVFVAGWLAAVIFAELLCSRLVSKATGQDRKTLAREELNRISLGVLLLAVVWLVPVVFFVPMAEEAEHLAMWTIMAMLMTAMAILLATVPLGPLVFITVLGLANAAMFAIEGEFGLMATVLILSSVLAMAVVQIVQNYVSGKISDIGLAEKDEVVSLLLREFEDSGADWLWQIDSSRRVRHVSPRFAYAMGIEAAELEGKSFIELIAGDAWATGELDSSLHELTERLMRRDSFSNLLVRVCVGGQFRWWELSASPKLDETGTFAGFRGVGSDVTAQRESADKIAHMARFDTLTGMPNRLQVNEAMATALQEADQWRRRCAFMMIDLDRFKAVNDTLGHLVGDRLLALVSQRLRSLMTTNEMCGRLGGDEFAVVIKDASDPRRVEELASLIISSLSRPYEVDQHTLFVGASVGSAIGPRDGRTVETLMRNADLALYRSKDEGGGNHFSYESKLHAHAEERRIMEMQLRNALANREIHLEYQPVVDAESEAILGFESLCRWTHPEFGKVSPAKFIPIAEDARLISAIGEFMLYESCREAMNWPSSVRVAVNVSAEQLLDPDFVGVVISAMAATGLPAHRLELEVTESIFMRDGTVAQSVLDQLIALGCKLSLDDFGTGYSSLGYLRKTRFNTIKVDRSFVQGAAQQSRESLAIIRAVVAMADSLDMTTTAEGVESAEEAKMVLDLGCTKIQGYHFGRPMSAEDARKVFAREMEAKDRKSA